MDPPQAGPYWNGGFDRDAGTVSENEMFDFAFHLPRGATLHRKINQMGGEAAAAEFLPAYIVYAEKKGISNAERIFARERNIYSLAACSPN